MTVLLVDDQINILSGLISGLNWDSLGVTAIRTAGNAMQAKRVLQSEAVDVLLCDIEMPGENGLSLLRWAHSKGYFPVCIFLTSHADFLYAKEAIQLNCFDYILQPARYDEIQITIQRAIDRAKKTRWEKERELLGAYAKVHPSGLFQNLFIDWMKGKQLEIPRICSILQRFQCPMSDEFLCAMVIAQMMNWRCDPWSTEEWTYGLNNILVEIFEASGYGAVFFSIDQDSAGWFLYATGRVQKPDTPFHTLNQYYNQISSCIPCTPAFYVSPVVAAEDISKRAMPLLHAKRDNVTQKGGVFCLENASEADALLVADSIELRRWSSLLTEGNTAPIRKEALARLEALSADGKMGYYSLHGFWLQFQQITLNAMWSRKMDNDLLLPLLSQGEAAQCVQDVKNVICEITHLFETENTTLNDKDAMIKKTEKYIESHIDQPLSVSNVAEAMYMNPDYLSRLFKASRGMSLKEYIVTEKMHAAQILLQTTALPVSIIASKLGYDNFSYFSQAYRKIMGISPSDERK